MRLYQSLVDQLRSRIIKYHETNGENRVCSFLSPPFPFSFSFSYSLHQKLAKKKAGSRRKPPPLPPLPSPLGNTQDSSVPLCPRTTSGRGPGREAKALEGTERHVSTDRFFLIFFFIVSLFLLYYLYILFPFISSFVDYYFFFIFFFSLGDLLLVYQGEGEELRAMIL